MVTLDIRNPDDLISTYLQIQIQRGTLVDGSDMADVATPNIDVSTATDLSNGFTTYPDSAGTEFVNYYRFRYKNGALVSAWSEIYLAGTTVFHNRFRSKMRDSNSNNYYFSHADITQMIQNAVNKLFPATYQEVLDETLATLANTRKYGFPTGIFRVNDIELLDSVGNVIGQAPGWNLRAKQIIFDSVPQTGYTMRLYAEKPFRKLAEVPETMDDLILDLMRLEAYETWEADRKQWYKYTTIVDPEGGNMPSIRRVIEELKTTTRDRLNQLRRVRRATVYTM